MNFPKCRYLILGTVLITVVLTIVVSQLFTSPGTRSRDVMSLFTFHKDNPTNMDTVNDDTIDDDLDWLVQEDMDIEHIFGSVDEMISSLDNLENDGIDKIFEQNTNVHDIDLKNDKIITLPAIHELHMNSTTKGTVASDETIMNTMQLVEFNKNIGSARNETILTVSSPGNNNITGESVSDSVSAVSNLTLSSNTKSNFTDSVLEKTVRGLIADLLKKNDSDVNMRSNIRPESMLNINEYLTDDNKRIYNNDSSYDNNGFKTKSGDNNKLRTTTTVIVEYSVSTSGSTQSDENYINTHVDTEIDNQADNQIHTHVDDVIDDANYNLNDVFGNVDNMFDNSFENIENPPDVLPETQLGPPSIEQEHADQLMLTRRNTPRWFSSTTMVCFAFAILGAIITTVLTCWVTQFSKTRRSHRYLQSKGNPDMV